MIRSYEELFKLMDNEPHLFDGLTFEREIKFKKWLPNNMHIYFAFVGYAKDLKKTKKRQYYSARAIWERLRWDSFMSDSPQGEFKMCDLSMPFISWLSMRAEPELNGMFKKRYSIP